MNFVKQIPNLLTLGNLLCGSIAAILAVQADFIGAALFVVIGIILDFFDGFAARLLNVAGELGKQLDSLADMVTSGLVPGIIMVKLMQINLFNKAEFVENNTIDGVFDNTVLGYSLIGLIITLGACYRLGKFNLDTRQTDFFIGLPTPAMSLFVVSLPLIQANTDFVFVQSLIGNNYFLIALTWILSFLMNAEINLFSLKLKDYSFKKNWLIYLFLTFSLVLILLINYLAIPIIIIFYVVLSTVKNLTPKI
ncbi:CDP-alcohol phosphatidyltransferase family protein [Polaribacter sp. R77954]|uniref:CDP-alcohol phosphatidyltransferase family protein n=1 Tax=Polaribacter sp. R77954 TaxID=3093870 RepID=UPI0037C6B724